MQKAKRIIRIAALLILTVLLLTLAISAQQQSSEITVERKRVIPVGRELLEKQLPIPLQN